MGDQALVGDDHAVIDRLREVRPQPLRLPKPAPATPGTGAGTAAARTSTVAAARTPTAVSAQPVRRHRRRLVSPIRRAGWSRSAARARRAIRRHRSALSVRRPGTASADGVAGIAVGMIWTEMVCPPSSAPDAPGVAAQAEYADLDEQRDKHQRLEPVADILVIEGNRDAARQQVSSDWPRGH